MFMGPSGCLKSQLGLVNEPSGSELAPKTTFSYLEALGEQGAKGTPWTVLTARSPDRRAHAPSFSSFHLRPLFRLSPHLTKSPEGETLRYLATGPRRVS